MQEAQGTLLRRHDTPGKHWTVWRAGDRLVKEYEQAGRLLPLTKRWVKEHRALLHLRSAKVPAPLSYGFTRLPGRKIRHEMQWIPGREPTEITGTLVPSLALRYAELHRSGVTHGDAALDNMLATDDGEIRFIDYGRARVFRWRSALQYYNIGKELARIRRRLFAEDNAGWQQFIETYAEAHPMKPRQRKTVRKALLSFLKKWKQPPNIGALENTPH